MTFGERLRKIRREHFVKQKQLANHLNIAVSTLSQYENNKRHPNFDILAAIARYFNVTTDYMLGMEKKTNSLIAQNIDVVDTHLNGQASYHELIYKMTVNLKTISVNNDVKSLRILYDLYNSVASIGMEYNHLMHNDIEAILGYHLNHKENIDQTLNKLFRHHIKIITEKTT